MYNKTAIIDKRLKKKNFKHPSKSRMTIVDPEKVKPHEKADGNRKKIKNGRSMSSSSDVLRQKRRRNLHETDDRRTELYKRMKKLLERKYKKIISKEDSNEKLFPVKNECEPRIYRAKTNVNELTFSEKPVEQTPSQSPANETDEDSRNLRQEEKQLQNSVSSLNQISERKIGTKFQKVEPSKTKKKIRNNITNQKNKSLPKEPPIQKRKLERLPPITESPEDKKPLKNQKDKEKNDSANKSEKRTRYKVSKRLAALARHRELPREVKEDFNYKPFRVPKRALLFRDNNIKLIPRLNEARSEGVQKTYLKDLNNGFEPNKYCFGHYRKRRRLFKTSKYLFPTQRIMELAKPMIKKPPVSILAPEEVFKVKKRALKARCSKRICELAFPVTRPEEFHIRIDLLPSAIKRRALRARCSRRVRELAKPLPRKCTSPILNKKRSKEESG